MYADFYNANGEPLNVAVFVSARDNGTMSRLDYLNETVDLMDKIGKFNLEEDDAHQTILGNDFKLVNLTFYQFCDDFCAVNEPVRQFRVCFSSPPSPINKLHFQNGLAISSNLSDFQTRIKLRFPFMEMLGRQIDLSPNFFGVQTKDGEVTNIEFLRLIVLQFRAEKPSNATKIDLERWERRIAGRETSNNIIHTIRSTLQILLTGRSSIYNRCFWHRPSFSSNSTTHFHPFKAW